MKRHDFMILAVVLAIGAYIFYRVDRWWNKKTVPDLCTDPPTRAADGTMRDVLRFGRWWTLKEYDSLSFSDQWKLFWSHKAVQVTVLGKKEWR